MDLKQTAIDMLTLANNNPFNRGGQDREHNTVHDYIVDKNLSKDDVDRLTALIQELIDTKYIQAFKHEDGKDALAQNGFRGITLKGERYLHQLKYPKLSWCKQNWFPITIVIISTIIPIISAFIIVAGTQ